MEYTSYVCLVSAMQTSILVTNAVKWNAIKIKLRDTPLSELFIFIPG